MLVSDDRTVLFGIEFRYDVGYKVICDGQILGNFFSDDGRWTFSPSPRAAGMMVTRVKRGIITVKKRAASMAVRGRGVYGSDILEADPNIIRGDTVFIRTDDREPVSIGEATTDGDAMVGNDGKLCVRGTKAIRSGMNVPEKGYTWKETVRLNKVPLDRAVRKSTDFIRKVIRKHKGVPYTVSLSGGKDSMATLLLVIKAGFKPTIVYADTHMDCGSSDLVYGLAKRYGLKMLTYGIPEDVFYRNMERLGPPASDYRWCCRVHQLAPFNILSDMAGKRSLTFIGQRRYESTQRMRAGSEWINPSSPNQLCASAIQDWNALHVWMFLTMENAPYNRLYEEGYDRIGCYYCPMSPRTMLRMKEWDDPVARAWKDGIDEYGRRTGMPQIWYDKMLWKSRRFTENVPGVDPEIRKDVERRQKIVSYKTRVRDGVATSGRRFDPSDVFPLLPIMGMKGRMEGGCLVTDDVKVSPEGNVTLIDGGSDLKSKADDIFDLSIMATMCLECTACIHTCKRSALKLKDQRLTLDASRCNGCRKCVPICPVIGLLRS